ncbi:hypothetical protein [Nocardioides ungokensis]|nr:hypothetical protein [Nocardioides ungokensis]
MVEEVRHAFRLNRLLLDEVAGLEVGGTEVDGTGRPREPAGRP